MLTTELGPVEGHLEKARTVVHFTYMSGEGRSEVERLQKNRTMENSIFRIVKGSQS